MSRRAELFSLCDGYYSFSPAMSKRESEGLGCWVRILWRCQEGRGRHISRARAVLAASFTSAYRFALLQISSHLFNEQLITNTLNLRWQRNSPGIIDVPSLSYRLSLSAIERRFCESERGCVRDDELSEVSTHGS